MRIRLPGYYPERLPSGNTRHIVRMAGRKKTKTTIPVGPSDPEFLRYYEAARRGQKLPVQSVEQPAPTISHSMAWLMDQFEAWMTKRVEAGMLHPSTLRQRQTYFSRLREKYGRKHIDMPPQVIAQIRDEMLDTPAAADNMVKALKAMYAWASHPERRLLQVNPATGIERVGRDVGATPWTITDLKQYRDRHPAGTSAHMALTLFMFTACRISDAVLLGPKHETLIQGIPHLDWKASKKGSSRVVIPILPPLQKAIDALPVKGPTYLLTDHGVPFASRNSFDNKFRKWIIQAGLSKTNADGKVVATRSSHGIRKAAGHLLALEGASQYHIMAVHGHTEAKTSEIYTKGVDRAHLAREAMDLLSGMSW